MEVKLRLHSAADHDRVALLLADRQRATYAQENYFFDGANAEFSSRRTIVRVRLYNTDEKATLTVKARTPCRSSTAITAPSHVLTASSCSFTMLSPRCPPPLIHLKTPL